MVLYCFPFSWSLPLWRRFCTFSESRWAWQKTAVWRHGCVLTDVSILARRVLFDSCWQVLSANQVSLLLLNHAVNQSTCAVQGVYALRIVRLTPSVHRWSPRERGSSSKCLVVPAGSNGKHGEMGGQNVLKSRVFWRWKQSGGFGRFFKHDLLSVWFCCSFLFWRSWVPLWIAERVSWAWLRHVLCHWLLVVFYYFAMCFILSWLQLLNALLITSSKDKSDIGRAIERVY